MALPHCHLPLPLALLSLRFLPLASLSLPFGFGVAFISVFLRVSEARNLKNREKDEGPVGHLAMDLWLTAAAFFFLARKKLTLKTKANYEHSHLSIETGGS